MYLAHKKTPTPLGQPYDPRHIPTEGSDLETSTMSPAPHTLKPLKV